MESVSDGQQRTDSPDSTGPVLKGLYSTQQMQLSDNLGQDTDLRVPFTGTAGVWERIGGFSELILHPQ